MRDAALGIWDCGIISPMKRMRKELENISDVDQIESYNQESERLACEAFANSPVAKLYKEEFEYVLGLIVSRMRALKSGEKPFPFRGYDADTFNRLLSAQTIVSYPVAEYDEQNEIVDDTFIGETWTKEAQQQASLVQAFLEYATAGAIFAKHIKSTSVRLWARLIDKLQQIQNRTYRRCEDEEADELVGLERLAVDRLRRDMIVEALPPFRKVRAKGRR